MGKVVGLVGAASGKIGNIVYAVTNGIQVARVYQPIVNNPKSALQNAQRAKGNLAGRMSSFVPQSALMGLGSSNRERRGEFLRQILKNATTTLLEGGYNAKINPAEVLFSKGAVASPITAVNISVLANSVSVAFTRLANTANQLVRLVLLIYQNGVLNECKTLVPEMPNEGATQNISVTFSSRGVVDIELYEIPMSTADGSAVSITSDMVELDDATIAAMLSVNENAVVFKYGRSIYLGSGNFTPVP